MLSTAFVQPTPVAEVSSDKNTASDFAEYLSHFKKVELPYSLNLEDLKQYENYQKGVSKKTVKKGNKKFSKKMKSGAKKSPIARSKYLPEVARGMFSRMGPPDVQPIARFYPNEKMIAVVYSSKRRFSDLDQSYNLAVYDLKGNVLSPNSKNWSEFNLGYTSLKQTITFRIDEKGNIWRNTYDNVWKNKLKKRGYRNNQLVDFQIKDTQVFKLNEKGVAEELKTIPSDGRAALN